MSKASLNEYGIWVAFLDKEDGSYPVCAADCEGTARTEGRKLVSLYDSYFIKVKCVPTFTTEKVNT